MHDTATWRSELRRTTAQAGRRLAYIDRGRGRAVLFLHGFPTWSYDWAQVLPAVEAAHRVVLPDFLGFGFSDKPRATYAIGEQADLVAGLVRDLGIRSLALVAHDYGTIVAQEFLVRREAGTLGFEIERLALLNGGIVYRAYRPTALQTALRRPLLGPLLARLVTAKRARAGLSAILGPGRSLSDAEFDGLWFGISHAGGQRLASRLLRYNDERKTTHAAWEGALARFDRPLQLVWGLADPISGAHVLAEARATYPVSEIVELAGVGHYPQIEAPERVAAALTAFLE